MALRKDVMMLYVFDDNLNELEVKPTLVYRRVNLFDGKLKERLMRLRELSF